jgi:hypothetical protein
MNSSPAGFHATKDLAAGLFEFLTPLHHDLVLDNAALTAYFSIAFVVFWTGSAGLLSPYSRLA